MTTPRKIGVLTFHRCINYGSYWQARCLVDGLRAMGHEAVLLDHHSPRVNRLEWRCALDPQLPAKSSARDRLRYAVKTRRFLKAFDALPRSLRFDLDDPVAAGDWDIVIVGSDEVWNLCHPWYGGHAAFYGHGIRARRMVAYAASFGSQPASGRLPPIWVDALCKFAHISVRDANSATIARKALGRKPETALDPCLLFPPAVGPLPVRPGHHPYVTVYGHGFSGWFTQALREFASASGYSLLSIGYRNSWADEQFIHADPDDFVRIFAGAAAVATNFFHGCVFALINDKPFACEASEYRANKVGDLVRLLSAEKHLLAEGADHSLVQSLLETPLGSVIGKRLAFLRSRSRRFLERALAP